MFHLSVSNNVQIHVELGLVYKTFVNKHTHETPLLPRKNKLHPLFTERGVLWEAEQGYLSHTTKKHTSLETFFPSESRAAVQLNEAR